MFYTIIQIMSYICHFVLPYEVQDIVIFSRKILTFAIPEIRFTGLPIFRL